VKVLIVGGVFGRDEEYRRSINPTPEMTLVAGLRRRGIEAVSAPHTWIHSVREFDLVHVHHLAKSVPGLAVIGLFGRTPVVFTRHNEEAWLPARKAAALWLVNHGATAFVALSQQEAERLRHQVRRSVVVIRNGIAAPPQPPCREPREVGPWRLLYAGQLIPRKGIDVLFRAIGTVRPHAAVSLRLVYHHGEQLEYLRTLARRLEITDSVTFVGGRDPSGMTEEYRRADALVLPSLAGAESLPSVITEALLTGLPVVASADAGIPEQVGNGGILVPPGDDAALATAIRSLISDYPHYLAQSGLRSAQIRREYSVDNMIDGHLGLYEQVLAARRGRHARSG
jgi:glycosyltransferase involved in cell wall biosynthesis